ncbi:hypothetical protein [Glaciecola sp. KUL10]|uniref:hypothetical protein n=1 Tax=Glaciecola sp. (strain KUL10) TaxID=2161813 RepID=UPI000D879490|nr:hypothetical protein [Glaciecola sp. KUL10]GBL03502.1 hypothetical protein KUL10_08020 [Glaciecola sp. KUL10]
MFENSTQTHFAYGVDTTRYKRIDIDAQGEQSTTWYIGNVEFVEKGACALSFEMLL